MPKKKQSLFFRKLKNKRFEQSSKSLSLEQKADFVFAKKKTIKPRSKIIIPLIALLVISLIILSIIFINFLKTSEKEKIQENLTTVYQFSLNSINQKIEKLNKLNNFIISKNYYDPVSSQAVLKPDEQNKINLILLNQTFKNPEFILNNYFQNIIQHLSFKDCFDNKPINTIYQNNELFIIQAQPHNNKCSIILEEINQAFWDNLKKASSLDMEVKNNIEQDQPVNFSTIKKQDGKHYLASFLLPSFYEQKLYLQILSLPISIKFLIQKSLILIILILIILSVIGALFFLIIRTLTKPLQKMVYAMRMVSKGNFEIKSSIKKGPQEFIFLSYQLDQMIVQLKDVRDKEKSLNKAQSEFLMLAAHQLRTPLTAVRWVFSGAMPFADKDKNNDLKLLLDKGQQSIHRAMNLIDDLLAVSSMRMHKMTFKLKHLNWLETVKKIIADASLQTLLQKRKIQINTLWNENKIKNISVSADADKIKIALENIIENAVKYSPVNAEIIINIQLDIKNNQIITSVKDQGIGITPDEQKRIFEKFFRGKKALKIETEGNGLGLYLSRQILKIHHGKIWFKSPADPKNQENPGTVFYISLPLVKAATKKDLYAKSLMPADIVMLKPNNQAKIIF